MSKEFNEALGKRVKIMRNIKEYSREEAAYLASMSVKFLYEVEHGKRGISAERLVKLAEILDTSCDFLLLGKTSAHDQDKQDGENHQGQNREFWK